MKNHLLMVLLGLSTSITTVAQACTIFVLADENTTLFANNEDVSKRPIRIWFVPEGDNYYGAAYVGFDDAWAQGGLNTQGLSYDWVAGFDESNFKVTAKGTYIIGNPAERMLESSKNVEQAVEFLRSHPDSSFTYAKVLIADKTGKSAIVGSKNGKFHVEYLNETRGFGFCGRRLNNLFESQPEVSVENGFSILKQCKQTGQSPTQYSNVYDLKTLDIHFANPVLPNQPLTFNLTKELTKGGHYYDIANIHQEHGLVFQPLTNGMKRLYISSLTSAPKQLPQQVEILTKVFNNMKNGKRDKSDFTPKFWQELKDKTAQELKDQVTSLGELRASYLIESKQTELGQETLYRLEFDNMLVLQRIEFDQVNRINQMTTEQYEITSNYMFRNQ